MNKRLLLTTSIVLVLFIIGIIAALFLTDDASEWSSDLVEVSIKSSIDDEPQKALYYASESKKPLIVSLHQWSSTYEQYDSISDLALDADWNYIRPNFRGSNDKPNTCGSDLVISDIDDAINYAIEKGNVDTNYIHVVGASGGGHAALMHFMKSNMNVNTYSSWVPITDLIAWYGQSNIRGNTYSDDILQCTDSRENLDIETAKSRSPLYLDTPTDKFEDTQLHIFSGINDGYDGAVPISHSINFYNKLITDLNLSEDHMVSVEIAEEMLYLQQVSESEDIKLGDRDIHYQKKLENLSLTIFDGGHEILEEEAFRILINQ